MSDFNYDSYCGLYCGGCSIIKAYQSGIKDPFACFWSDEAGAELKCHGCKTDTVFGGAAEFGGCAKCAIRACAREKGVERCLSCPDFPCHNFNPDTEIAKFLFDKLPHMSTIATNLQTIMSKGASGWLEEQVVQWKCPDCQTDYTWYATHCSNCGKDLGDLKPYKNTFDTSVFQMMKMPDPDEIFKKKVVFELEGMDLASIHKDIAYSVEQGSELLFDLYFPPNPLPDKKLPLVVLVHGEAPVPNIKDSGSFTSLGRVIAASGFAAVAFNHRVLMQGAGIKDVISDIENILAFLIDHADEYGIDKNQIAIWSFSMGVPFGLYAGIHNSPAYIKCIVAYYGFGDFTSICNLFGRTDEQAEEYSPVQLLSQHPDKIAPMLVARAGMDQIPTILNSLDNFIKAALENNIHIDIYNHPTGVHSFEIMNDNPRTHEIIEKTLEFLKRHSTAL
jgi:predicted esterase